MGAVSSAPIEAVRIQKQRGKKFSGAVAEMQGWRDSHEDSHFMYQGDDSEWACMGVLDGHGGTKSARLAAKILPLELCKNTKGRGCEAGPGQQCLAKAFMNTDDSLKEQMEMGEEGSGSTIISGGLRKQEDGKYTVYLSNAGDSRAMILKSIPELTGQDGEEMEADEEGVDSSCPNYAPLHSKSFETTIRVPNCKGPSKPMSFEGGKKNSQCESESSPKAVAADSVDYYQNLYFSCVASEDHKPDRKDERARIKAAGGWVSGGQPDPDEETGNDQDLISKRLLMIGDCARLDGNLAVSRGFADFQYKRDDSLPHGQQKVSSVPEVYLMRNVDPGNLVILACDGIFDVMSNHDVIQFIYRECARFEREGLTREEILGKVCESCVRQCLILDSKDNMTMMLIQIGNEEELAGFKFASFCAEDHATANGFNPFPAPTTSLPPKPEDIHTAKNCDTTYTQLVTLPGGVEAGSKLRGQLSDSRVRRMYQTFFEYLAEDQTPVPSMIAEAILSIEEEERSNSASKGKGKKGGGKTLAGNTSNLAFNTEDDLDFNDLAQLFNLAGVQGVVGGQGEFFEVEGGNQQGGDSPGPTIEEVADGKVELVD